MIVLKYDNCDIFLEYILCVFGIWRGVSDEGKGGGMSNFMKEFLCNFLDIWIFGYKGNVEFF